METTRQPSRLKPTLIVVTDAHHFRLFSTGDHGASINHIAGDLDSIPNPPSRDHKSERPGRAFSSSGVRRSAIQPKTDPHEAAEKNFAKAVAEQLETLAAAGAYNGIVLFAPPSFLGALREHFGRHSTELLRAQVHKDLTKSTQDEIRDHVEAVLKP
ncbi:MAG TPA: host attachment protein [Alphaproteobacteria bacterium]|nr:host attachment protein [Alphaproteobacteria bacterium]